MEFTGNRLEMIIMSVRAMKLANENSPMTALKGVLIECDEEAGEVTMTTTNYEAAILLTEKATVLSGGKLVLNAKLLNGMLTLLRGDMVTFKAEDNGILKVSSDACVYSVPYLPGSHYPKPVMSCPHETVKLSGIRDIADKTVFVASSDKSKPVLQCVSLKIKQNSAHAAACDGARMMLVKGEAESDGVKEFLLPAQPFHMLASISFDSDVYDVGIVGNEAVFAKKNMIFSIRQNNGSFIDTNTIIQSVKPVYTAITNAAVMRQALDLVTVDSSSVPVRLTFADGAVRFFREQKTSVSRAEAEARLSGDMPKLGFLYNADYLQRLFTMLRGAVKLDIDERGIMLVRTKNEVYLQMPILHEAAVPKQKTQREKKAC